MITLSFILVGAMYLVFSLSHVFSKRLITGYKILYTTVLILCTHYSLLTAQTTTTAAYHINLNSSYSNPCCNNLVATFTLSMRTLQAPATSTVYPWIISKEAGPFSYYWSDGYSVINTMDTTTIHTIQAPFTFTITTCCSSYTRYNYSLLCPNTAAAGGTSLKHVDVTVEKAQCETVGSLLHINYVLYESGSQFCPDPNNCPPARTARR